MIDRVRATAEWLEETEDDDDEPERKTDTLWLEPGEMMSVPAPEPSEIDPEWPDDATVDLTMQTVIDGVPEGPVTVTIPPGSTPEKKIRRQWDQPPADARRDVVDEELGGDAPFVTDCEAVWPLVVLGDTIHHRIRQERYIDNARAWVGRRVAAALEAIHDAESDELSVWSPATEWIRGGAESTVESIVESTVENAASERLKSEVVDTVRSRSTWRRDERGDPWEPQEDRYRDSIGVANGLLLLPTARTDRLETGPEVVDPDPAARATTKLSTPFDPADDDRVKDVLGEIAGETVGAPDAARYRRTLEEVLATALLADNRHAAIPILHGDGSNGKSTIQQIADKIMDGDTAGMSVDRLESGRFALSNMGPETLLNMDPDISRKKIADMSTIKSITGDDKLPVEIKGGGTTHERIRTTLIFGANQLPILTDSGGGDPPRWLSRRLLPIPAPVSFVDDPSEPTEVQKRPNRITDILESDEALAGGLAILVDALERLERRAADPDRDRDAWSHPLTQTKRIDRYQLEADGIQAFAERCLAETGLPSVVLPIEAVDDAYRGFCERSSAEATSKSTLMRELRNHVTVSKKRIDNPTSDGRVRVVEGLALTPEGFGSVSSLHRADRWVRGGTQVAMIQSPPPEDTAADADWVTDLEVDHEPSAPATSDEPPHGAIPTSLSQAQRVTVSAISQLVVPRVTDADTDTAPDPSSDAAATATATDGGSSGEIPDPDAAETLEERRRRAVARTVAELDSNTPSLESVVARTAGEWGIDPGIVVDHIRSRVDDGVYQIHDDDDDERLEVIER